MSEKIVQLNEEAIKGQIKELVRVKISKVNSTVRLFGGIYSYMSGV